MCGVPGRKCLYHKPCHTPMEPHGAPRVLANVLPGRNVAMPDGCCGKAGTLAVIPPDISVMIRLHKEEELVHPATHGGIDPVLF
ncbi:MAG: hypothetical protein PVF51_10060 [Nitrospirota bacterium]